jgi:arylsulfatase A-like enzyme
MTSPAPNVVLVMTDQQQAKALGCYGHPVVRTPNLDALARDGAQLDWAFVPMPLCVPSRCSLLTGRYPTVTRSRGNGAFLGTDERDLAKVLREQGYNIALCGKNHCYHPDVLATWDYVYEEDHVGPRNHPDEERLAELSQARIAAYHPHAIGSAALPWPKEEFGTYRITQAALEYLEQRSAEPSQPFFLWLSYPDPHPPYVVPEELDGMYDPASIPLPPPEPNDFADKPVSQWVMSHLQQIHSKGEHALRQQIARYYTNITFIDEQVGRVMHALEQSGLRENTLVIFTADHGDFAGEHSCVEKGPSFYDCLVRAPLILHWPGHISPQRIGHTMCETIDAMPTILEYLNLQVFPAIQGRSLKPLLEGQAAKHKEAVFAFHGGHHRRPLTREEAAAAVERRLADYDANPKSRVFRWITPERMCAAGAMVRTKDWKLVHYVSGEGELYDLSNDPDELHNLYAKPEYGGVVSRLRAHLLDKMILGFDPRMPQGFDPTLHATGRVRP